MQVQQQPWLMIMSNPSGGASQAHGGGYMTSMNDAYSRFRGAMDFQAPSICFSHFSRKEQHLLTQASLD